MHLFQLFKWSSQRIDRWRLEAAFVKQDIKGLFNYLIALQTLLKVVYWVLSLDV